MSDDLAQAVICLVFTFVALAVLLFGFRNRSIGGSDHDNSAPILEENDDVVEPKSHSRAGRRISAFAIVFCLVLTVAMTVVTLTIAGTAGAAGKCPLGF